MAAPAAGPAGRSRRVLLINGDQVSAVPAAGGPGPGAIFPGQGGRLAGADLTLRLGGQAYVIPVAAMPYLDHGLDPGLFRLSALLSAETAGRLPVRISYQGTQPAVPGVTITSSGPGEAQGYLTASSARAFGAALTQQYLAGHARGNYGGGPFGDGLSIALGGATATKTAAPKTAAPQPAVTPDFPMATLTVDGTDAAGQPDNGDEILVFNADNSNRFSDPGESASVFSGGVAKFSVPTGRYWAISAFPATAGDGEQNWRVTVLPQFTVTSATTVHIAAAAATSKITMVVPRPAAAIQTAFYLLRGGASGPPVSIGLLNDGQGTIRVSPSRDRPTVGTLRAYAAQVLASPSEASVPYQYALEYVDPAGIISSQRYLMRPRDVATVDESYYQTGSAEAYWDLSGLLANDTYGWVLVDGALPTPGRDVLYAGGNLPALTWQRDYEALGADGTQDSAQYDGYVKLPAGAHLTEGWNRYPLHPDANTNPDPAVLANATQASASRSGNTLRIDTTPFTDNQPGDYGLGFVNRGGGATSTGRYQIDENGRKIAAGNAVTSIDGFPNPDFSTHVKLSRKPSVVTVTLDAAVSGSDFPLSTASKTVWTWRSAYQPATKLPTGWYCSENIYTGAQNDNCAVQPMTTLRYDVHRMALDGSVPAGRQVIGLTVGHLQLARAARITGARVSVSFDDGKTWHRATVTRSSGGQFTAAFTAPAGAYVTLRTRAADAAGGSIAETISRAYQIAS